MSRKCETDYTLEETEFAVFCVENLAENMGIKPVDVYDMITRDSDILNDYIIPCYDILHTQGKDYIVANITEVMKERGVEV